MVRRLSALLIWLLFFAMLLSQAAFAATPADYNKLEPSNLLPDHLYSGAAILIDADSGNVLFAKNEHVRMHPASTTKIMTLLLAVESGYDLNAQVAIPQAAADITKDSSLVPVFPGETMRYGDLLVGFMLNSGNDGANAVAVIVSGSVESFVRKMNERAEMIGCKDTHFANAHGLTDDNHYTTAYDLALITREAMKNPTFRSIVALGRAQITVNERGKLTVGDKNFLLKKDSGYYYADCIGVKTGSTNAAGKCFVGAAEKDGATLISVSLKAVDPDKKDDYRWMDTIRLFDYGWTCYDRYTLDQMFTVARERLVNCVVSNAAADDPYGGVLQPDIAQISHSDYLRMVEHGRDDALSLAATDFINHSQITITHTLAAPIARGEIIGDFTYYDESSGTTITAKLVASRDVQERIEEKTLLDYLPFLKLFGNRLFLILLALSAVLLILLLTLAYSRRASKQRKRKRIYEQRRRNGFVSQPQHKRSTAANARTYSRSASGAAYPRSTATARSTATRTKEHNDRRPR